MIDYVSNLLLNMSAGLLPEHLSEDDVELLQKYTDEKHGKIQIGLLFLDIGNQNTEDPDLTDMH